MEFRQLGKTDLKVSLLCLGTMSFGEQNTEKEAHEQLDCAIDAGINFIDTAEMYAIPPREETCGLTEKYIGTWIKKYQQRDKYLIATKVAGPGMDYVRGGSRLSRKHVEEAIDHSLKKLQTDFIGQKENRIILENWDMRTQMRVMESVLEKLWMH